MSFAEELLMSAASGSIEQILKCAVEHTGLAISLMDNTFATIMDIGMELLPEMPNPPEIPTGRERRKWNDAVGTADEPLIDDRNDNTFRVMCTDVRYEGKRIAKLVFFEARAFIDEDKHSIQMLAAALSGILWQQIGLYRAYGDENSGFLLALLNDKTSRILTDHVFSEISVKNVHSWRIASVVIGLGQTPDTHLTAKLVSDIPNCFHTIYDQTLSILIPAEHIEKLKARLDPLDAVMGVSRPYSNLFDTSAYWPQALYALRIAVNSDGSCKSYETLFLKEVAGIVIRRKGGAARVRAEIGQLDAYDREHETELKKTLETYIRTDRSIAETAKQLYIHYNTVKYRLKMIREITGLDRFDAQNTCELLLSFEMLGGI